MMSWEQQVLERKAWTQVFWEFWELVWRSYEVAEVPEVFPPHSCPPSLSAESLKINKRRVYSGVFTGFMREVYRNNLNALIFYILQHILSLCLKH